MLPRNIVIVEAAEDMAVKLLKISREEFTDTDSTIIIDENSEIETPFSYFESDLSQPRLASINSGKKLNSKEIETN